MINLDAPITPGVGAAGLTIGTAIENILQVSDVEFSVEQIENPLFETSDTTIYRSSSVDLWVTNGIVVQIMIHGDYRGSLLDKIMLGHTLDDVQRLLGPVILDDEDNLVVESIPNVSFELDLDSNPSSITEIYLW